MYVVVIHRWLFSHLFLLAEDQVWGMLCIQCPVYGLSPFTHLFEMPGWQL